MMMDSDSRIDSVNALDHEETLAEAVRNGRKDIVEILLSKGANPFAKDESTGKTAMDEFVTRWNSGGDIEYIFPANYCYCPFCQKSSSLQK